MKSSETIESRCRRSFLQTSAYVLMGGAVIVGKLPAALAREIASQTALTLRSAAQAEMNAYHRYVAYARKARSEDYDAISYLFIALATSELIHAQNYNRSLIKLGVEVVPSGNPTIKVSGTKKNLVAAAEAELHSINTFYPKVLGEIDGKGNAEALRFVHYAWESHKQHKDLIDKIKKYAPTFFETVARRIDDNIDVFYICEICGSTTNKRPTENCPICGYTAKHYEKLEPRAFLG